MKLKRKQKQLTNLPEKFKMLFCFFLNLFSFVADPKFSGPILNATVAVGRDAVLTCMVEDLGAYKVSFGCVN